MTEYFPAQEYAPVIPMPDLPRVESLEDANKLEPGSEFIGPEGKKGTVPYRVETPEQAAALPEGAYFLTPDGKRGQNPKFQGVGFTAQALHDMALTDEGREKALKVIYGDKVKTGPHGLYVDDDGTMRKADGRGLGGVLGHTASEVAPLGGMTAGMAAGGAAGLVDVPLIGAVPGGYLGMVLGAAAGRATNNAILALAGIHEPLGTQVQSETTEGALAATGEVVGKGLSKIPGAIAATRRGAETVAGKAKGLKENLSGVLESVGITPERARWVLGTSQEAAQQGSRISAKGGRVAPSAIYHESPYLKKIEEFDAVFRSQNVFGEAAENYYNQEATKILESPDIGASIDQLLTRAEKKVSSEKAGELALAAAQKDLAHDDGVLENTVHDVKAIAQSQIDAMGGREAVAKTYADKIEALNQAHKSADTSARAYIDAQITKVHDQIDEGLAMSKRGEDPSALFRMTGAEMKLWMDGTKARAKIMYNAADGAAGDALPDISSLHEDAADFLQSMPEAIRQKYPVEIRDLEKLAGREADAAKKIEAVPPAQLTFGQLHHLRSWFRYGIDYADLTPDMRTGALKFFEKKINGVLHAETADPALKQAAELLDRADAFYKQEVPFFNDEMVKGTIKALESGVGANPEALAKVLFDPERTAALRRVRGIVGENLWKSVQAAHVNDMLQQSRTVTGQVDATKFAALVHNDIKNNLIATGYDEATARKLTSIAQDVAKLDGKLPIAPREGDTLTTLLNRAQAAKQAAEKLAANDPIAAFDGEMKKLNKELAQSQKTLARARRQQPLHFLDDTQMSHMAVRAADKILGSQDLLMAASDKFGRTSPEFNALRQVYTTRFAQRALGRTGSMRAELGGEKGMTEEMQALMFPGVTRNQMLTLVHDMEFLFSGASTDVGGAMAAASRVLNPMAHIPIPVIGWMNHPVMSLITKTPGIGFVSRLALGKFFAFTMDMVSHPNFMHWLAGNLKGSEAQRAMARDVLRQRFALGGWMGAAAAQTGGNPADVSQERD